MGTVGGGAAVVTGTGAFTSVTAERTVNVEVTGDASAYLEIEGKSPHKDYIHNSNGEFAIDLTGSDEGANGVNADANTVIEDLFQITNKGTQEVELDVTPLSFSDTDGRDTLSVFVVPKSQGSFPSVTLGVGKTETYSLCVDAFSPTSTDLNVDNTIEFFAEAT